ncbi:MAG: hypothetical protein GXZ11_05620 [Tissierellia bacterium]|nr:hypothetical protein [Tissierellia bacterium]
MKVIAMGKDITEICGNLSIRGSTSQVARTLELNVIRPKADYYLPSVDIKLGSTILVIDKGATQFSGIVWFRDMDDNKAEQRITAYDMSIYVAKSEPEKAVFENQSCSDIASSVLGELGLPVGRLEPGEVVTINGRNQTAYDIIMGAYAKASRKNKKVYHMVVENGAIHVVEKGQTVGALLEYRVQDLPGTLVGLSFEESIDNMINKTKVIRDKENDEKKEGNENSGDQEAFGLVQKIIRGEVEDTQGILKGARTDINVECFGDWAYKTGYSVNVKGVNAKGKYYIAEDVHSVKDNIHTVKLQLTTENTMKGADGND